MLAPKTAQNSSVDTSKDAIDAMELYIKMHTRIHSKIPKSRGGKVDRKKIENIQKVKNNLPGVMILRQQNNHSQYNMRGDASVRTTILSPETHIPTQCDLEFDQSGIMGCFGRSKSTSKRNFTDTLFQLREGKRQKNKRSEVNETFSIKRWNSISDIFSKKKDKFKKTNAIQKLEKSSQSIQVQVNRDYMTSDNGLDWKWEDPSYEQTHPSEINFDFSFGSNAFSNHLSGCKNRFNTNNEAKIDDIELKMHTDYKSSSGVNPAEFPDRCNAKEFTNQFNSDNIDIDEGSENNCFGDGQEFEANGDPKPLGWVCIPFPVFSDSPEATVGNPGDIITGFASGSQSIPQPPSMSQWQSACLPAQMDYNKCIPAQTFLNSQNGARSRCPHKPNRAFIFQPNSQW